MKFLQRVKKIQNIKNPNTYNLRTKLTVLKDKKIFQLGLLYLNKLKKREIITCVIKAKIFAETMNSYII